MLKYLLVYILLINLVDAFLTMYGLQFHYISESNPLMHSLYLTDPWLFLLLKGGLSLVLLFLFFHLKTNKRSSRVLILVSVFAAVSYSCVFLMHGYWLLEVAGGIA